MRFIQTDWSSCRTLVVFDSFWIIFESFFKRMSRTFGGYLFGGKMPPSIIVDVFFWFSGNLCPGMLLTRFGYSPCTVEGGSLSKGFVFSCVWGEL